jgi:TPR repeat protein
VPRDDREAVRWYRAAAEQGHRDARNNLGSMYEQGRGVGKDLGQAARLYRAAAEAGDAAAQLNLARLAGCQAEGRGGIARSAAAAADSYYRAGLAYLREGRKDEARRCAEALRRLEKEGDESDSPTALAERLLAALASP